MKIKGKGSVIPLEDKPISRCKKWRLTVSLGRDLATGKYKKRVRRFNGSKTEATKALRDFIDEIEGNNFKLVKGEITYSQYVKHFLSLMVNNVAYGTYSKYIDCLKCFEIHVGKANLLEITPQVIESVIAKLKNGESPSRKKLSGAYIHSILSVNHKMFRYALKENYALSNPFDLVEPPQIDTKERTVVPIEKLAELVEKLDPSTPAGFAIRLIIRTGLRRGEAGALNVSHFSINDHTLTVDSSVDRIGNINSPKTEAGVRVLPIPESVEQDFKTRLEAITSDFKAVFDETGVEVTLDEKTPLLCNSVGERLNPDFIRKWWERNREELGFANITVHDLRHSYLTAMARKKVDPKILQKLAGHAKYTTTMQIYVHADEEEKRQAVSVVDW